MEVSMLIMAALGVALCLQCIRLTHQRDRLRMRAGMDDRTRRILIMMATAETLAFVTERRWRDSRGEPLKLYSTVTFRLGDTLHSGMVDLANYPGDGRYDPSEPYVLRYICDGQDRTVRPDFVRDLLLDESKPCNKLKT